MNDKDAHTVLRQMRDAALAELPKLEETLAEENADYANDPNPLTARIIEITTEQVVRKQLEAEALAIAVSKF